MAKAKTGSSRRQAARIAYRQGQEAGFPLGWAHGHWYGRCGTVLRDVLPVPFKRPVHIMYVATAKDFPFIPLDEAVHSTLLSLAERVTYVTPDQDIAALASALRPDLVLVLDGIEIPLPKVQALSAVPVRKAIWFTDDPYYTDVSPAHAVLYDYVFTNERNCIAFYTEKGCPRVHHLALGTLPAHFAPRIPPLDRRCDISFTGTAYANRLQLMQAALPLLAHRHVYINGRWWERMPDYARWASRIELNKWMTPLETSLLYNASRIVLNAHRSYDDDAINRSQIKIPAVTPNPRTFEIAACGTLQLVDHRDDLAAYYTPGKEIVVYYSAQDLAAKAEHYLHNEEERRLIALRALYRTMRNHTYVSRINKMFDIVFAT